MKSTQPSDVAPAFPDEYPHLLFALVHHHAVWRDPNDDALWTRSQLLDWESDLNMFQPVRESHVDGHLTLVNALSGEVVLVEERA